jgi:peptide/nickel transport system permease protein
VTAYVVRRLFVALVVVLGVSLLTFTMLHVIGGSPGTIVLGTKANKATVAAWNKEHGFDNPFFVQYGSYLWQLLHGNLGQSYKLNQSVDSLFIAFAPRSALLSGSSLVIALVIAVPMGIFQALKRNSLADNVLAGGAFIGYAMPVFLTGLLLIQFFALGQPFTWFPAVDNTTETGMGYVLSHPNQLVLPVAALTVTTVALFSRYMRSSALDVLAQDYIKVARAKGLNERLVMARHLLRNACLPIITLIGLLIPALLAGNLIVEALFNFPGLGYMFYQALGNEDYQILLAYTLFGAMLTVIGNLIADVALTAADPRIRLA